MANVQVKDAAGSTKYLKSTGTGTDPDPFIPQHLETNSGDIKTAVQVLDDIVLAEDAAHGSGDKGVMALAVRKDTGAALAETDGDYTPLQTDDSGNLRVYIAGGSTSGTQYDEGDTESTITGTAMLWEDADDTLKTISASSRLPVAGAGDTAHDAADTGNPVKIGGKARQTNPTAVSDGDRVDAMFDDMGRLVVVPNAPRDLVAQNSITVSNTSETDLLPAGGSGVYQDLTQISITNSSNTAVVVSIRDAASGTVRLVYAIAANGGVVERWATPFKQAAANSKWTVQLSGSVSSIYINAQAIKTV